MNPSIQFSVQGHGKWMHGDGEVIHVNDVSTDMTQAGISKHSFHTLSSLCYITLIVSLFSVLSVTLLEA